MNIASALSVLSDEGIPVCHPPYMDRITDHVTYRLIGQTGALYAEGQEAETGVRWLVTVNSVGYNAALVLQVKSLLTAAGYSVVVEDESYDADLCYVLTSLSVATDAAVYY